MIIDNNKISRQLINKYKVTRTGHLRSKSTISPHSPLPITHSILFLPCMNNTCQTQHAFPIERYTTVESLLYECITNSGTWQQSSTIRTIELSAQNGQRRRLAPSQVRYHFLSISLFIFIFVESRTNEPHIHPFKNALVTASSSFQMSAMSIQF